MYVYNVYCYTMQSFGNAVTAMISVILQSRASIISDVGVLILHNWLLIDSLTPAQQ